MAHATTSPTSDLPALIRELRASRRLTQEQLARQLDVTFGTVNGWENGKHRPTPGMARRLTRLAQSAGVATVVTVRPRGVAPGVAVRATTTPVSARAVQASSAWPRGEADRRDFYHRIREFPRDIAAWRNGLVESAPNDARFPAIEPGTGVEEIRKRLDMEIARLREIHNILHLLHGSPTLGNKRDPVDELVYIILSRKTPEEQYQRAFVALKERFPTWDALLRSKAETVRKIVGPGGLARKKEASIRGSLVAIKERFGSISLEAARKWSDAELEAFLCSLPEVSRKSAYCVMMYAFGRRVFPVDAHVGRVLQRLGLHRTLGLDLTGLDHKQLQTVLADLVPPNLRLPLHVNLVTHGRAVCTALAPKCGDCDLARFCASRRTALVEIAAGEDGPLAADLFCGAGGLTEGFHRAGIRTAFAADLDEVALRTFRLNQPSIREDAVICGDVRELTANEIRKVIGRRRLDILAGAPPCQGFSTVGMRSKQSRHGKSLSQDTRNYLYEDFVRLAAELRPRLVLFENVPGMESARLQQQSFVDLACKLLQEAGYTTAVWKLDASRFGVPQFRSRIFVVGSRTGTLPARPEGAYSAPRGEDYDRYAPRPIGLGHAIFDLPPLGAGDGAAVSPWSSDAFEETRARRFLTKYRMRTSPRILFNHTVRYHNERDLELYGLLGQGEDSMHIVERGRRDLMRYRTDAFDDKYMRLDEEIPCKTIVSHLAKDGNGYVHPTQTRSISLREAARVQTFHDGFVFCGAPSDQWVQLGNAVPPVLGEAIGRSLRTYLDRSGE